MNSVIRLFMKLWLINNKVKNEEHKHLLLIYIAPHNASLKRLKY